MNRKKEAARAGTGTIKHIVVLLFIFGCFCFLSWAVSRRAQGICFALCLMILALYMGVKSEIFYMVFPGSSLWPFLEFGTSIIVSYPLLFYVILRLPKGRQRNVYTILFGIELTFLRWPLFCIL